MNLRLPHANPNGRTNSAAPRKLALAVMFALVASLACDPVREPRVTNDTDQPLLVSFEEQGWVSKPTRLAPGKTVGWGVDESQTEVSIRLFQPDGQVIGCLRFSLKGLDENATVTQKASAAAPCQ